VTAADHPPETEHRSRHNRKVIHATCALHRGPASFVRVLVSKCDGEIILTPHVDGSCVLTLAEDEAIALRDALIEWLG
jgi:hypothetical protein